MPNPPTKNYICPKCGAVFRARNTFDQGSAGKAAVLEGFRFIGIEREAEYVEIALSRIEAAIKTKTQWSLFL